MLNVFWLISLRFKSHMHIINKHFIKGIKKKTRKKQKINKKWTQEYIIINKAIKIIKTIKTIGKKRTF